MTYSEKLKNPRWQKKRLERLEESDFSCDNCGDGDSELAVHHRHYKKGAAPWEYDNDDLLVLCKKCHERLHTALDRLMRHVGRITTQDTIERLCGYAMVMSGDDIFPSTIKTPGEILGLADAYRTTPDAITRMMRIAKKEKTPLNASAYYPQMLDEALQFPWLEDDAKVTP